MLLRLLALATIALGMFAGAASAAASHSSAPLGHLVFSKQVPPCGNRCMQRLAVVAGDASGEQRLTKGGAIARAPSWSPNGKLIAFWRRRPGSPWVALDVMRSTGGGWRTLLPYISAADPVTRAAPTWSPDGRSLLVLIRWSVFRVSLAPHPGAEQATVTRLFALPGDDDTTWWPELHLSPNGKWLALATTEFFHTGQWSDSLYLVQPNGKAGHVIRGAGGIVRAISWSPDSSRLAYVSVPCTDDLCSPSPPACGGFPPPELWTVRANGSDAHEVWADTCESGNWVAPDAIAAGATTTWSPDGTEILYPTKDYAGYQLHEANVSTGAIQPFAVPAGDCGSGPGSCRLTDPQWTAH